MSMDLHPDPTIREWLEAALHGDLARLVEGLDAGFSVDTTDNSGMTALMRAAFEGQADAVRLLIDRGADLHAVGRDGLTPLAWAIREAREEIAAILRAAGASR